MWNNPSCSKCAAARNTLDEARVPYRLRAYLDEPPTAAELIDVLRRLGAQPWEICRTGEPVAQELGLDDWSRDESATDRWVRAMVEHPELIQRPILLLDDGTATVGRTPEALSEAVRRTAAKRIAMWSGPRNISTALLRSFGQRGDAIVVDEPLYAHYLAVTGIDHPGRGEVIASQPTAWEDVAADLTGPLPAGKSVYYQKHMAHHLIPDIGRAWIGRLTNAYLLRDPAHVVASYAKVRGTPDLADLGYVQQVEIFRAYGGPVVDAADLLTDPPGVLERLCAALDIDFDPAMLSWPPGRRETDGVWAPYWYSAVEASTGFARYDPSPAQVPEHLQSLVDAAQPYYDELAAHRL
jgi:arsenate reductase (glutaredoxin)